MTTTDPYSSPSSRDLLIISALTDILENDPDLPYDVSQWIQWKLIYLKIRHTKPEGYREQYKSKDTESTFSPRTPRYLGRPVEVPKAK